MSRFWASRRSGADAAPTGDRSDGVQEAPTSDGRGGVPAQASRDEPSDEVLLSRHVAGDADAFGELVRRHRDRLWAVAIRTIGDPEEAADAVQDALVAAFRRARTFRGEAAVTTWLHRIVVNACLDRVRRQQTRPTVPLVEQSGDNPGRAAAWATSPDRANESELALDITAALLHLPIEQRAALVLVDMHGYSVEEAAKILDVAVGTIKSRCARGRARLLPLVAHLRLSGPNPPPVPATAAAGPAHPASADDPKRNPDTPASVQPVVLGGLLPPRPDGARGPSSVSSPPPTPVHGPHTQGGDPPDAP